MLLIDVDYKTEAGHLGICCEETVDGSVVVAGAPFGPVASTLSLEPLLCRPLLCLSPLFAEKRRDCRVILHLPNS